ncbi:MAG: ATP-binding protein [Thermodesulfobacteriota bacterium]
MPWIKISSSAAGPAKWSIVRIAAALLFFALGFAGNHFKLSLFYGFDFLFGSIFLIVLLNLAGIAWAVPAAVVATLCTYSFWHHPYGIVTFSLEILFLGIANRKRDRNIVLLDGMYWLLVGSPLNYLLYTGIMKASHHMVLFVILKQSVNGIFNALIASAILDYVPIRSWAGISGERKRVSIQQALFNLILAVLLLPVLFIMVMNSRKAFLDAEKTITNVLKSTSVETVFTVDRFLQRHLEGVEVLALSAGENGAAHPADLRDSIRTIRGLFPSFSYLYVADRDGRPVAAYPERYGTGEYGAGARASGMPLYEKMKDSLRPCVSDVFTESDGASPPVVALGVPIFGNGGFEGFALGVLDLVRFKEEITSVTEPHDVKTVIVDGQGRVVISAARMFQPTQPLNLREKGEVVPSRSGIFQWLPPKETAKSAFNRWTNSYYFLENPVGDIAPWKALLFVPVAPYQKQLYETTYIHTFSFMLVFIAVSIFFSEFLSRKLVHPFERLKEVTTDLPSKLAGREKIDWPESVLLEIHSLVRNFKAMTASLAEKFVQLKTANESLAGEKELLSVTLLSIGEGVITTDTSGRVALMNKVSEELTGWAQRDAGGRPLAEIFRTFDAKDPRKEIHPLRDAAAGALHVATDDLLLQSRDGAGHIVSGSYAPIRDPRGDILGGVLVFRDKTEKKKMEERLLNAQKLESVGVLAGGIAHDFNNLLSAIVGNLSMVKAGGNHPSVDSLEEIEKAAQRAVGLTQQLLTFSKGGAPVRKAVSVSELIRQSAVFVTRGSSVRCEFRIEPDLRPAFVDEGQLSQVVNNLVINAMQAMEKGGVVRISAENVRADSPPEGIRPAGAMVRVSVRDDGPGIPAEVLPRIFDPYFTTKERGSGLGLATVYSIVKRHDGHIEVESRPGEGTEFHVYLPVSEKLPETAGKPAEGPRNGKGSILLMDDEEAILRLAQRMLGKLGYETACSKDGAEAIGLYERALAAGQPYDAVIMDLTIPGGMGGKEAIGILKRIDPGVVAIVSSGYSNDPVLADPARFGFSGIVPKPYTLQMLSEVVHKAIDPPVRP